MANKFNVKAIHEAWIPMVKAATNGMINESTVVGQDKLNWMAEYAHNHTMAMNENAQVYNSNGLAYNNLFNTMGIGNPMPAQAAGQTAVDQASSASFGSADKWPALLPIALQVAAKTIAFDLVNTTPFSGPSGVIPFLDYVYAGSKQPGGAAPYAQTGRHNPEFVAGEKKGSDMYDMPSLFQASLVNREAGRKVLDVLATGAVGTITIGEEGAEESLEVAFVGLSRVNGEPIFEPRKDRATSASDKSLLYYFVQEKATISFDGGDVEIKRPRLVSMLENHILGYSGAGKYDTDSMSGNWADGTVLFDNMDRATGETQYPRQLALEVFTKYVTVGTQQIAIACTQEQVTDLNKQWGINVMQMLENAAVNELSMTMNKQILSRLFALGWKNHLNAYYSEGINLNLNLKNTGAATSTKAFVHYDEEGVHNTAMPIPAFANYGGFENRATILHRIATQVVTAGNVINQRGRRGPANFVVCNAYIATALQTNANYSFSPIANTFSQNNGNLYPLGTVAGMTVYVDPNMKAGDNRVLVGRKGDKDEPGLHFCPYLMAEKISTIAEATMSPKMVVKSRYALVDVGFYPETQYLTLWVESDNILV